MALVAYAGTSARFSLIKITPVLTSDAITYAGTPAALVSVRTLSIRSQRVGEMPKATTLESTANAEGELAGTIHRGGEVMYVISIQGLCDQVESAALQTNPFVQCDFIVKKDSAGSQEGWGDVPGKVENWQVGTGVGLGMATCSFEVHVSGHLPAFATTN